MQDVKVGKKKKIYTFDELREKDFVTTHEASRLLYITPTTVIEYCKKGKIKTIRTEGGHRRIPQSEITKILIKMGYFALSEDEKQTEESEQIEEKEHE